MLDFGIFMGQRGRTNVADACMVPSRVSDGLDEHGWRWNS